MLLSIGQSFRSRSSGVTIQTTRSLVALAGWSLTRVDTQCVYHPLHERCTSSPPPRRNYGGDGSKTGNPVVKIDTRDHCETPGLSKQPPGQHAAMQTGTPLTSINVYPPMGHMAVGGTPQPLILPFSQTGLGPYMNTMYLPTHPASQASSAPPMYMQVVPTAMDR